MQIHSLSPGPLFRFVARYPRTIVVVSLLLAVISVLYTQQSMEYLTGRDVVLQFDGAALLALRDQVIAPIIAGVRSPRKGRKPITWTPVDRDYETLRIDLQTLFTHLGITTTQAAAA